MSAGKPSETPHCVFASPIGHLALYTLDDQLTQIRFVSSATPQSAPQTPNAKKIVTALHNYFKTGKLPQDLPLRPQGTPFQRRVWEALQQIPDGITRTYGELAKQLNTSARAIGNACRTNPIPILIPCHRILGQRNLGGYMGATAGECLFNKRYLLDLEK